MLRSAAATRQLAVDAGAPREAETRKESFAEKHTAHKARASPEAMVLVRWRLLAAAAVHLGAGHCPPHVQHGMARHSMALCGSRRCIWAVSALLQSFKLNTC